ncbi:MAG: AI-2E family transporter [Nanoarchaeota archaeon]|nr:AI-2E family transporter [Nanoarchaeota archaeon]
MNFNDQDFKKAGVIFLMIILGVLTFFLLKSVLLPIVGGLLLAYIFSPLYRKMLLGIKNRTLTAFVVSILVIIIIVLPLWFVIPIMLQQVFDIFALSQTLSFQEVATTLFPTANSQFAAQFSITLTNFINQLSSGILKSLTSFFLDLPTITIKLFIVFFVFFYALRDGNVLKEFVANISPFNKTKEKILVSQFKNITDSVVYGQIIVGLVQGGLAGLGFLIFGIDNALVLTTLAIFFSILPIVGPFIIWIPVAIFLISSGQVGTGIAYLLYNLLIVSTFDNFLRTYFVARRTDISPAIIFVSMIGGFTVFGIIGLILGPLIAAYFVLFLQAYRDRTIMHLFHTPEEQAQSK